MGKEITQLRAAKGSTADPFDHFLTLYGGFLPSGQARWCTKELKLRPFERYVGDTPTLSYVAIRGDENREGYISKKPNIQAIFPFRRNIWSREVIHKVLHRDNIGQVIALYEDIADNKKREAMLRVIRQPMSESFNLDHKLNALFDLSLPTFNRVTRQFLKTTAYPLNFADEFPLLDDENVITREDVFQLLADSGVGLPKYYDGLDFNFNGDTGTYARSRSGCYFCFYQQRIEWVWLYEQHPDLFKQAMAYEKDGFTWSQRETLSELSQPERIAQIKREHLERKAKQNQNKRQY
ncbi:MAG: phosphoadenosine phosphosulfate reductase, partial [Deltaproteobacteria bacterium]|nr:phosphoadenosine phosphosulfate reductase [Deltaproteobacteria bacterium]